MIIKSFETKKFVEFKSKGYLFYGENDGHKKEIINNNILNNFVGEIIRYDENGFLNNYNIIYESLLNRSFFDEHKILIISNATDKILANLKELMLKNIDGITIILNANLLEKKSKLRNFFEKEDSLVCTPFYLDEPKTLTYLANNFFKKKKISISQESINLIIERCRGDRNNLYIELEKINNFTQTNNKITQEEIIKLTNLASNYNITTLADYCLSKNLNSTIKVLNENNFSTEDTILILRTILSKSKRILTLKKEYEKNNDLEKTISDFRPPIFWKDKEIVKKQIIKWSKDEIQKLLEKINFTELEVKKNSFNSIYILNDFILTTSKSANN